MNYMGVDIGTSGCKAVVFDENGKQLSLAYLDYSPVFFPDGGAELNSAEVLDKTVEVIKTAALQAGRGTVAGIGVSSQGEAFTPVDGNGNVLANAMISSDSRAGQIARQWPETFGIDKLYRITGHTAHPMFSLFKLLWLKANNPDVWQRAWKFLCFEDLLGFRLGVDPAMGWPLAGRTMLFDVVKHDWNVEILDAVGLSREKLARPLPSGTVAGRLAGGMSASLGLAENAAIVTGGHDQICGALGAGVISPGMAMYATGTVECITPAFPRPVFTDALRDSNLCTYDHAVGGMYATVAFSLTGGNILKWFRDEFGEIERLEAADKGSDAYSLILDKMPDAPTSLMVLPYFTPSGTPFFDTDTKGAIIGLRLSTTRDEFAKALLEGVAFEMKLNLDILEKSGCKTESLRAVGGGAKSRVWTQLKADVTGRPISVLDVTEAGCLGVAILACGADTGSDIRKLAKSWIRERGVCEPRSDIARIYNERFQQYLRLYPAIRQL